MCTMVEEKTVWTGCMDSDSVIGTDKDDTVWIGFMDIVPVIGMVKEAVELVLALYEGNEAVIKEKEKVIENIVKESSPKRENGKRVELTPPTAAEAAAADEFSGLRNVRGVREAMITEYVSKVKNRTLPKMTPDQRKKKVEDIKNKLFAYICNLDKEFYRELGEELKRSKRGEHVFNNNILKFHYKVVNDFKKYLNNMNIREYGEQVENELARNSKHTLSQNTEKEIQEKMVAKFDLEEIYLNANAFMYGKYSKKLRVALLDVLKYKNRVDVTEEKKQEVRKVIDDMNTYEIYVDQMAKIRWIANDGTRGVRFTRVRQEVANMYSTDHWIEWCYNIIDAFAPLFNNTQ